MCRLVTVYPRVGGETRPSGLSVASLAGLSPRGRGNRVPQAGEVAAAGSIPAWAGKPIGGSRYRSPTWVYPRVGGETSSRFVSDG